MEEKSNMNELSRKFTVGRAGSSAYVKGIIREFYEGQIRSIYPTNYLENEACDYMQMLLSVLEVDGWVKTYGKTIAYFWNRYKKGLIPSDLIACLCFPACDVKHREYMHPFYQLPLKDYLEALGREDLYEKWFRSDAEAWERDHKGCHPALCDVLEKLFRATKPMKDFVAPYKANDSVELEPTNRIYEAFRRRNNNQVDSREAQLAMTWATLLLMEAPVDYQYRSYERINLKEETDYAKTLKKGSKENG